MSVVPVKSLAVSQTGGSMATESPRVIDEIQNYIDSWYVGALEAVWRILKFDMSGRYPIVFCVQLPEENSQTVFFSCRRRVNQTTQ